MADDFKIFGAVRWRGKAYTAGQEQALLDAGFNPKDAVEILKSDEARLTARERMSRDRDPIVQPGDTATPAGVRRGRRQVVRPEGADEGTGEGTGEGGDTPLSEVPVKDLRARLAQVSDPDELKRLADEDERSTAAPLYAARLEELEEQE